MCIYKDGYVYPITPQKPRQLTNRCICFQNQKCTVFQFCSQGPIFAFVHLLQLQFAIRFKPRWRQFLQIPPIALWSHLPRQIHRIAVLQVVSSQIDSVGPPLLCILTCLAGRQENTSMSNCLPSCRIRFSIQFCSALYMELAAHAINFHIFRDVLFSEDLRFGLIVRQNICNALHNVPFGQSVHQCLIYIPL